MDPQTATREPAIPRAVVVLIGAAALVVVIFGLKSGAGFVAPVMLALVLTIAVAPLGGWARRRGWPAPLATLLVMVAAFGLVVLLALALAYSVVQLATTLPSYVTDAQHLIHDIQVTLGRFGFHPGPTNTALQRLDFGRVTSVLTGLLTSLLGVLGNLFFLLTLLFFLTAEASAWSTHTSAAVRAANPTLGACLTDFVSGTQRYLVVSALFGAVCAVLNGLALWVIGVPSPAIWALLSFVTNFIPNVGFVIALVPPAVLGLLVDGWRGLLLVLAAYVVINVVIQTFIQPRFIGNAVDLSTAVTFLSVAFWGWALGALGALLAVPMTLLVRALLVDADPRADVARIVLSGRQTDPPPGPPPPEPS